MPKTAGNTRAERIGAYWDMYYAEAERLANDPRFLLVPTDALNHPDQVKAILEHAGVEQPNIATIWVKHHH
jgi:hypothetical protein